MSKNVKADLNFRSVWILTVVFSRQCSRWLCWCSNADLFFTHRAVLSLSWSWTQHKYTNTQINLTLHRVNRWFFRFTSGDLNQHLTENPWKSFNSRAFKVFSRVIRTSAGWIIWVLSLKNSLILQTDSDGLKCFCTVFNMICGWHNLQMWQKQHFVARKWKLLEIRLFESHCSCKKWLPVINLMSERTVTVKTCCQVSSGCPGGSGQISN